MLAVASENPWSFLERRVPAHRSLADARLTTVVAVGVLVSVAMLASQVAVVAPNITTSLSAEEVRSFSDFAALPKVARYLDLVFRGCARGPKGVAGECAEVEVARA